MSLPRDGFPSVLIVCDQFPPMKGGIGDYTVLLANALIDQGVSVSLFVPSGSRHDGCRAPIIATYDRWSWSTLTHLHRELVHTQADWCHLQHNGGMYKTNRLAAYWLPRYLRLRRWQGKFAVTFHDINPPWLFPKAGHLRHWVVSWLARSADLVIAADNADLERLLSNGAVAHQVLIGSNLPTSTVDLETVQALRSRYRVPADHFLVGHFGTGLGLDTLFEAMASLPRVTLLLVGKTQCLGSPGAIDQVSAAQRSRLHALGITDRVRWTSHLPPGDAADAIAACDAIALPYPAGASLRHGGLCAAISQGRAVVTTTPQTPFVDSNIHNALVFVPPNDVRALVNAIYGLLTDPDRRRCLEHAATTARNSFSWETIARQHARLYRVEDLALSR